VKAEQKKERTPRLSWAGLPRRTFALDVLACAGCGGRRRVLAYFPTVRFCEFFTSPLAPLGMSHAVADALAGVDDDPLPGSSPSSTWARRPLRSPTSRRRTRPATLGRGLGPGAPATPGGRLGTPP
jgi:hypothetical protein